MVDKDVTGVSDKQKQSSEDKERTINAESALTAQRIHPAVNSGLFEELDSDGSGDAFSATEQVKE